MSPVKFVHVLKRLEVLDRDIEELRRIESSLEKGRTYSTSLNISLELQINHLLNERVKLMELRIENPPEHLVPSMKEIEEPSKKLSEVRGSFTFADLEQDYLDNLMKKEYTEENKLNTRLESEENNMIRENFIMKQGDVDDMISKYSESKKESNLPVSRQIQTTRFASEKKEISPKDSQCQRQHV